MKKIIKRSFRSLKTAAEGLSGKIVPTSDPGLFILELQSAGNRTSTLPNNAARNGL